MSSKRSGWKGDHQCLPSDLEAEYQTLKLALCDGGGFRLVLANCEDEDLREDLTERLAHDLRAEGVRLIQINVATSPQESLLGAVAQRLKEHRSSPSDGRYATSITGIDIRVEVELSGPQESEFLRNANLHRDAFPEACAAPLLLWFGASASDRFAREAPDLWHWRSATADFQVVPEAEGGADQVSEEPSPAEDGAAPDKVDAGHVATLKHRLDQIEASYQGREPTPGELARRMNVVSELGVTSSRLGDPQEAARYHQQQLDVARRIGDRLAEGSALARLGQALSDLGEHRRAEEYCVLSVQVAREVGSRRGEAEARQSLLRVREILATSQSPRRVEQLREAREAGVIDADTYEAAVAGLVSPQQTETTP